MSDEAPILDQSVIDELRASVGGDDAFIADLVATYLAEGPGHLDAIAAGVAAGDAGAVVRPAHTLKSSSASLGAMRLSQLAREIEFAGRDGESAGLADQLEAAQAAWAATVIAMQEADLA